MTKLDILKKYLEENIWDSSFTNIKIENQNGSDVNQIYGNNAIGFRKIIACWNAQGGLFATPNTKYFGAGLIYHMSSDICSDSSLNDGLLFCKHDHLGEYDWYNAKLIDSSEGYISFVDGVIDPDVVCILGGKFFDMFCQADEPEDFIPFEINDSNLVKISDDDYDLCIQCLGYPFITEDELEYTRDQITNLAIKPALDEYFKWFPKVEIQTIQIVSSKSTTVQFPQDAYDVAHFDVQQGGASLSGGAVTNTLWRSFEDGFYGVMNMGSLTGSYFGSKAPTTSTSSVGGYLSARSAMQGMINYTTRTDFHKFKKDGQLFAEFYSTKGGVAEIHWAMRTHDFDDIEFSQRQNVIDYCSANVKLLFANLRKQIKTDIPGTYDYGSWISEANETKEKIKAEWKEIVHSSGAVIRGSL